MRAIIFSLIVATLLCAASSTLYSTYVQSMELTMLRAEVESFRRELKNSANLTHYYANQWAPIETKINSIQKGLESAARSHAIFEAEKHMIFTEIDNLKKNILIIKNRDIKDSTQDSPE